MSVSTKEILNSSRYVEKINEIPEPMEMEEEEVKIEDNLMFQQKSISIFKLYFHISGKLEIFLTIIAIIMTIVAGCSNAIINWIFSDSSNNFSFATEIELMRDLLGKEAFDVLFEFIMNEMVKPLIILPVQKP